MANLNNTLRKARDIMRAKHMAYSTEKQYLGWIKRYSEFSAGLKGSLNSSARVEAFMAMLAADKEVSASTQNQAFSAILLLYRDVLRHELTGVDALRAKRGQRVPDVLSHADALRVIGALSGDAQLITRLLYGSGLRLMEALRLRVKDVKFTCLQLIVLDDKGDNGRITLLSPSLVKPLRDKIEARREQHLADQSAEDLGRQYIFASPRLSVDPRSGAKQRRHILPANVQRAIAAVAKTCGLDRPVSPHVFRDSFATRLLEQGVPLNQLKDLMGEPIETVVAYLRTVESATVKPISPIDL